VDRAISRPGRSEPRTGRFARLDPIEDGVGDPQRWNRYAYALNSPVVNIDPSGENAACDPNTCNEVIGHAPEVPLDLLLFFWGLGWSGGGGGGSSSYQSGGGGGHATPSSGTGTGTPTPTPTRPPTPTPSPNPPGPNPAPCPKAPAGVSLTRNTAVAKGIGAVLDSGPFGLGQIAKYVGTYFAFRNHGLMDYKNQYPNTSGMQDVGNFSYGAVTAALGIPGDVALRAAGWGQIRAGTSLPEFGSPLGSPPYGDDPHDQDMIRLGILFANGTPTCK
jgi:hypothetical protein